MTQNLRRSTHTAAIFAITLLAALAGVGCSGMGDQTPAIKKAIETHLASRSDLAINQMTMDVQSVQVERDNKDRAGAEVLFRVTNAPEMQMGYHYDLAREAGSWKVVEGHPSQADSKHPSGDEANDDADGAAALPPGHPPLPEGQAPMSGSPSQGGALPEGHPPLSSQ
ncbi:MAG: hypothetical protein EXQ56_10710 [Acidobacteria bacterium]|nr:hypothetical protein [Acidobacteriota bacterium]